LRRNPEKKRGGGESTRCFHPGGGLYLGGAGWLRWGKERKKKKLRRGKKVGPSEKNWKTRGIKPPKKKKENFR